MRAEYLQDRFGRSPDPGLLAVDNNRSFDQAWVCAHGCEQALIVQFGVSQAEFTILWLAGAQQVARRQAQQADNVCQFLHARCLLEILDRVRLEAVLAEQSQRLAALGAARIVINGQCHQQKYRQAAGQETKR